MDISSLEYKRAFDRYLRTGIPIGFSEKQSRVTTHYIWRTRKDGKVRPSHAANDGKIFTWDNPPSTGHPGEDYGCRCVAEPYVQALSESFDITFNNVSETGTKWESRDFVDHYFFGNGRAVTVRQTGNLRAIVAEYRREVIDDPKRLPGQIADKAREYINQSFFDTFKGTYEMRSTVYSIGDTVIKGNFRGSNKEINGVLHMSGSIEFRLRDEFRDPLNIGSFLPERYAKIDEIIAEAVSEAIASIGNVAARTLELADDIVSRIEARIGEIDRQLRDYIYNRALDQLRRQKNAAYCIERKDLREIPGGTPYDIVDDWSATFSAKVFRDKTRSRFTR